MKKFALTGLAGYIAPRHLRAIRDTGNTLAAALDVSDSVGIIDSFFPDAEFFTEPEAFEAFLEAERYRGKGIDYLSICTPNYLHAPHIRMAFRLGADAICEKPLVLTTAEIDALREMEERTGKRVWTILQLRVHPALLALRERMAARKDEADVLLTYITGRGKWYHRSWKVREDLSGGLAANIGVHFFDMLSWFFGPAQYMEVHLREQTRMAGFMQLERARVRWFLSINLDDVPEKVRAQGQRTYRSITIEGEEVEFSGGFTDLHTTVYQRTLDGQGFGLDDAAEAIRITEYLRRAEVVSAEPARRHPFLKE